MEQDNRPLKKTNIQLSKAIIDSLVISSLSVNYIDKSDFVEYTTASGQKIMVSPAFISTRK